MKCPGRCCAGLVSSIPWRREAASTKPHSLRFCMVQCSQALCAKAHARKAHRRTGLRLRMTPRKRRHSCGFIIPWRRAAQAAGLRFSTKPRLPRFCMVQCSQAHAQKRIGARRARSRASGGLEVIIPWRREAASTKPHSLRFCMVQCSQALCAKAHQRTKSARPRKRRA